MEKKETGGGGNAAQTLSDIIRGMQHAVNSAQDILQDYQLRMMEKFFKDDGTPYLHYVKFSDGRIITIPTIALLPQSLLSIEELEMSFAVTVSNIEKKEFTEKIDKAAKDAKVDRSSFLVNFARRHTATPDTAEGSVKDVPNPGDTVEVKIKFKSIPLPEGAARIMDSLNMDIGNATDALVNDNALAPRSGLPGRRSGAPDVPGGK